MTNHPSPDPGSTVTSGTPPAGSVVSPPPPVVPDHELLRRIGRGAYGEVWLARSVTGAFRAVKIVHRASFDHDRPFEREFEGILKFEPISRRHDSQVDILHVGRAGDCFYYVMELADDQATGGQIPDPANYQPRTLKSDLLFRNRLPFEECVQIGIALATALEQLHASGLVHRDVKPSNIIFVNGVAKLADIGLVTGVDATRSYVGTEGFAAPEGPGTVQADLYSLGKVLYEAATGKDRQEFPELPTQLRELPDREGLMELNAVIAKACRHDPKDRYASAAAMRADLELLQSGKSLARLHRIKDQLRFVRRVGALVSVLAALVCVGWLWQARQTRLVRDLAEINRRIAEEKTTLAAENSSIAQENRERLVRLNIANGIREMNQGDLAVSLVSFTEALKFTTNNPIDAAVQRVRIAHLLERHPRLLHVFPHPGSVQSAAFSPDEQRVVTGCIDGTLRIWDTAHDKKPETEFAQNVAVGRVRFSKDARRLFVVQPGQRNQLEWVAVLDAASGNPSFPPIEGVTCATLSSDDRWLAVARTNFVVQMIATATGRVVAKAIGHEQRVGMIQFSSDSSQIITASDDRTVRRWDTASGQPIGSPLRHAQRVTQAFFNCDGSRIATATAPEESAPAIYCQIWDAANGEPLGMPFVERGSHSILSFDISGRRLLTAGGEATARVWDVDSQATVQPTMKLDGNVRCVDFSPDGAFVAIGSEAGTVEIRNVETGSPVFPPLHCTARMESVRFNADGSRLLTASDDGTVKIWDLTQLPDDGLLSLPAFQRSEAALASDGRNLLLGIMNYPPSIHLVELDKLAEHREPMPDAEASFPGPLTFDQAGNQWASAVGPRGRYTFSLKPRGSDIPSVVGLWRRDGDRIRYLALPHEAAAREAFFHRDGSQLLTLADDRMARIWNTSDGSIRQTIPWAENDGAWIAVSPDLSTAITLAGDANGRHMVVREVQTGNALGPSPRSNPDINAAAFSPDGLRVATVGDSQAGRIWDARTGQPLTPFFKHGGALDAVAWSPDGKRILTAGQSPEVRVWDAVTGEPALTPLLMKAEPVLGAQFSADGRFIVAHSDEQLVRVWDAATGEAITPLLPHQDNVIAAYVTAAPQLVTVHAQCVVRVWNLKGTANTPRNLSDYASLLAGNSLNDTDSLRVTSAEELAAQLHSSRVRLPNFFATDPDQLRAWHRRLATEPKTLGQVQTAIFHLERLNRAAPGDDSIAEQLNRCRALLIPARDPAAPPRLIDLTRAYTHSFGLLQHNDYAELPRGIHELGGVPFDLRGLVQLDHRAERVGESGPFHPLAMVAVGLRCRTLHFLQAAEGDPRIDGSVIARWIIHYADGSAREWPVIYGKHLRDWWWWPALEPLDASDATVAWRGRAQYWNLPGTDGVRLFDATWSNPQPDLEITKLEYRIGESALKPFVVAITAE